jgi:hypothetical protein
MNRGDNGAEALPGFAESRPVIGTGGTPAEIRPLLRHEQSCRRQLGQVFAGHFKPSSHTGNCRQSVLWRPLQKPALHPRARTQGVVLPSSVSFEYGPARGR